LKILFTIASMLFLSSTYGSTTVDEVLGSCKTEFSSYLTDAKMELIRNSIWNYDNDYYLDDVQSSLSTANGKNRVEVYVYFDIAGLRERGFTYSFQPYFEGQNKEICSHIDVDLISVD
jgi:hypothetical protein